jgi:hypothetical protein
VCEFPGIKGRGRKEAGRERKSVMWMCRVARGW